MRASRFFHSISLRVSARTCRLCLPNSAAMISLLLALLVIVTGCDQGTLYAEKLEVSAKDVPRWWKGNLHTHTLWSDGRDYPEMVVEWYKRQGYHFLALSDHNILSQGDCWIDAADNRAGEAAFQKYVERFGENWVEQRLQRDRVHVRLKPLGEFRCLFEEPGRFLLIQAEEITDERAHLNAFNITGVIQPRPGEAAAAVLRDNIKAVEAQRRQTGQPMFAQINHPNFRWALRAEDIIYIQGARFFEVYNGHSSVHNYGDEHHVGTERMWDIVLTRRFGELTLPALHLPILYGIAADDAHHYHRYGQEFANPGRGWVVVRAPHLTPESIIKAMEAGDFYASTGVVLNDVEFDGKTLKVVIKPKTGVSYTTQFIGTMRGYDPESRPVVDANGVEIQTTRIYSDDIGKVLAEVKGPMARYTLTGKEIYVRARVTSSKPKANPHVPGEAEVAWVQPVVPGWN